MTENLHREIEVLRFHDVGGFFLERELRGLSQLSKADNRAVILEAFNASTGAGGRYKAENERAWIVRVLDQNTRRDLVAGIWNITCDMKVHRVVIDTDVDDLDRRVKFRIRIIKIGGARKTREEKNGHCVERVDYEFHIPPGTFGFAIYRARSVPALGVRLIGFRRFDLVPR